MPLQPSDEQLYRAVINLQASEDFKTVRAYLGRRHLEEMSRFHSLSDEVKTRWAQGRDAEILDLYEKTNPLSARVELEKLMRRAAETQAAQKVATG